MKPNIAQIILTACHLAGIVTGWKMPDAISLGSGLAPEQQFSRIRAMGPTPKKTTIDLNTNRWLGKEEHYSVQLSGQDLDDFSIFIIPTEVSIDDPDLEFQHFSPRTDVQLASDLNPRAFWQCKWLVGCFEIARVTTVVTAAQISAAVVFVGNYLRNANYAVLRKVLAGYIEQFTIGVIAGVVGLFIGNKIQAQDRFVTDVCNQTSLEAQIAAIQADIQNLLAEMNKGDRRPRRYDHMSEDDVDGLEGAHLVHTVVPAAQSGQYKNIGSC